jgi:hypothetical protein
MTVSFPPPLAEEGGEGACGLNARVGEKTCPLCRRFARRLPRKRGRIIQFARVQVCVLQMMLITQPLSSAVFGPVRVNEPV